MNPMSVSPSEIEIRVDLYREAKASGRQLTRHELDYLDEGLRPNFLDGWLDISTRDDFTDEEVVYADLLVSLQAAGRRSLSQDEAEFAEVVLRHAYVRQLESDAIEREDADREREREADRLDRSTW
jgi:hypothetical protein